MGVSDAYSTFLRVCNHSPEGVSCAELPRRPDPVETHRVVLSHELFEAWDRIFSKLQLDFQLARPRATFDMRIKRAGSLVDLSEKTPNVDIREERIPFRENRRSVLPQRTVWHLEGNALNARAFCFNASVCVTIDCSPHATGSARP